MSSSLVRPGSSTSLLHHLVESPRLVQRVRDLKPATFSRLIQQVGVEDAGELVALATTEQLVQAFDEDLFHSDRPGEREAFDAGRFVTWLEVLLEAGEHAAAGRVAELSEDFVAHALDGLLLVFDQDELNAHISVGGRHARLVDKLLDGALSEELDGYLLIARRTDGWDAVLSLVLALDRDHRELLVRVLDHCVAVNRELMDDLEALSTTLTEGASLADDVEAERDQRRARQGFVEPRDARAFLALARSGKAADLKRDAVASAYLKQLERVRPGREAPSVDAELNRLEALIDEATGAEEPRPTSQTRPLLPSGGRGLVEALQALGEASPADFSARMEELAFLANVLVAGATVDGRRLRPSEAAEAALCTVALGAELIGASPETLRLHSADSLFRAASTALGDGPGFVRNHSELAAARKRLLRPSQE